MRIIYVWRIHWRFPCRHVLCSDQLQSVLNALRNKLRVPVHTRLHLPLQPSQLGEINWTVQERQSLSTPAEVCFSTMFRQGSPSLHQVKWGDFTWRRPGESCRNVVEKQPSAGVLSDCCSWTMTQREISLNSLLFQHAQAQGCDDINLQSLHLCISSGRCTDHKSWQLAHARQRWPTLLCFSHKWGRAS